MCILDGDEGIKLVKGGSLEGLTYFKLELKNSFLWNYLSLESLISLLID
jgi:hypothetical protein